MGKNILAVVAGFLTAIIVIFVVERISHSVYPPPASIDFSNPEALKELMKNAPTGSLIIVIIGWAIGSFAGGFVASLIAPQKKPKLALIVGVLLMLSGLLNLMMLPHPVWMWIFGLIVNLPFAYLGSKMVTKKQD